MQYKVGDILKLKEHAHGYWWKIRQIVDIKVINVEDNYIVVIPTTNLTVDELREKYIEIFDEDLYDDEYDSFGDEEDVKDFLTNTMHLSGSDLSDWELVNKKLYPDE